MNNYNGEDIQKANNARKMGILSGFVEFEKGNNFDKKNDEDKDKDQKGSESGLEKKEADVPKIGLTNPTPAQNAEKNANDINDPIQNHAKNTPDEHLSRYIDNNPDGEHVEAAKNELASRQGGGGEEGDETPTVDYNDPEQVKQAIASSPDKDAIVAMMLEDTTLTASMALKMFNSSNPDNAETHAKIDAVEQALDALKAHTGHGDGEGENNGGTHFSEEDLQAMPDEELKGIIEDLGYEYTDRDEAIAFIIDTQEDDEDEDWDDDDDEDEDSDDEDEDDEDEDWDDDDDDDENGDWDDDNSEEWNDDDWDDEDSDDDGIDDDDDVDFNGKREDDDDDGDDDEGSEENDDKNDETDNFKKKK